MEPGEDIVYIEYLGVAPEHQNPPVGTKNVQGIGTLMLARASQHSDAQGLAGRIGLHSKKDSEGFYKKRRMEPFSYDATEDGIWLYFEIGPEQVDRIAEK